MKITKYNSVNSNKVFMSDTKHKDQEMEMGETTPLLEQETNISQFSKDSPPDKTEDLLKDDQLAFVKKVLGTIATQLTLTFITAVISSASDRLGKRMG
jgi:hypothetical protein